MLDSFFDRQLSVGSKVNSYYSTEILQGKNRKDPKKVGGLFEALFYRILFKGIRDCALDETVFDSQQMGTYREMQDDELANHLGAMGHLGVVKMMTDFIEKTEGEGVVRSSEFHEKFNPKGLLKG